MTHSVRSLKLSIDNLLSPDSPAPLYQRFEGQTKPQPAYVCLSEDGEVTAYSSGEVGSGCPEHVYSGRLLRWEVPAAVRPSVLSKLLQAQALALLERVHAGHEVSFDGSNMRGRLSLDAQQASDELETLFSRLSDDPTDLKPVWFAGDWLWNACSLSQHWNDQSLDHAVAQLQAVAEADDLMIEGDIRTELLHRAHKMFLDGLLAGDLSQLSQTHLSTLIAEGLITQADIDSALVD